MRVAVLVVLAILAGACGTPVRMTAVPPAGATTTPAAPTPAPTAAPRLPASVASPSASPAPITTGAALVLAPSVPPKLNALIESSGGGAAVMVADGDTGKVVHELEADEVVFAASLYKLGVLVEAESRIERGRLRSTDKITVMPADLREGEDYTPAGTTLTVEQALERMITLSDNATALALVRMLGTEPIHHTLANQGIKGLYFASQGAVTTARAVATLLGGIARGTLVSPRASARMLARLSRQRVVDRIPAALPAGSVLGNKTGNLEFVTHDAGLLRGPGDTPVVLVVLTWDSTEAAGSQLIRDIAAAVYGGLSSP